MSYLTTKAFFSETNNFHNKNKERMVVVEIGADWMKRICKASIISGNIQTEIIQREFTWSNRLVELKSIPS